MKAISDPIARELNESARRVAAARDSGDYDAWMQAMREDEELVARIVYGYSEGGRG